MNRNKSIGYELLSPSNKVETRDDKTGHGLVTGRSIVYVL
jgi:hypothetical protein